MAVFVAADANLAVNMYQLFAFEPSFGSNTIDLITPPSPSFGTVTVTDNLSPAGLSPNAAITHQSGVGAGNGELVVDLGSARNVDLSGFNVGTGVSINIEGSSGADTITGTRAGDTIIGREGNDRLYGGDGADFIVGSNNRDIMTGGADADRFVFGRIDTSKQKGKWDVITDFTKGSDKIDFSSIDGMAPKGATRRSSSSRRRAVTSPTSRGR